MQNRTAVLMEAEFMPEVVRYHMWGLVIFSVLTVFGIVLLPITFFIVRHLVRRYYERLEVVLTRRDLKVRRGIINIEEKSIPLEKITDLAVYQGVIMRLFDLKGIRVETAGQSSAGALVTVVGIRDVDHFRDTVLNQRDRISDADDETSHGAGRQPQVPQGSEVALLAEIRDSLKRIESRLAPPGNAA